MRTLDSLNSYPADINYPEDALHVFAYNSDVDNWNSFKISKIVSQADLVNIPAIDDKKEATSCVDLQTGRQKLNRRQTGGLHTILTLAIDAKVMLLYNIDTSDGLVNGVMGIIKGIVKTNNNKIVAVLVKCDNTDVGRKTLLSSKWKNDYPGLVPIERREAKFDDSYRKGAQVSRYQFPLTLGWAVSIHKCQVLNTG